MNVKRIRNLPFVLVALALLVSACAGNNANTAAQKAASEATVSVTRGSLVSTVSAIGNVRSAQNATLTWQASGKVGEVTVQIGQPVKTNDVLASLDPATLPASLLQAQISVTNAQKALDTLLHPTDLQVAQAQAAVAQAQENLDNLLHPNGTAIAQAQAAVLTASLSVTSTQNTLASLYAPRGTEAQISQARSNYLVAQANVDTLQERYDSLPGDPNVDTDKALALSSLNAAVDKRDKALFLVDWYSGSPTAQDITVAKNNLELAKSKLADAVATLSKLKNPTDVDVALATTKVTNAQKSLDNLTKGPDPNDLIVAQNNLTIAKSNLNAAHILAPFDGTVTDLQVAAGDQVNTGKTAFRVDDLSKFYVDLSISEIDYPKVKVGQPVTVTLDALPNKAYSAVVSKVGTVGTTSQNIVNFTISVELTNPDNSVKVGMSASADIEVARADNILNVATGSVQANRGKYYVYLVTPNGTQRISVQTGVTSDISTEVISDQLKEGDQVLLTPPVFNTFGAGGG